jgi:hypothetical protein
MTDRLADEVFCMMYHMHQQAPQILKMPIKFRKKLIEKFIEQRKREEEEMKKIKRK